MISLQPRFIFVKVPKTAGTSMARALKSDHVIKPPEDIRKPHISILEIRDGMKDIRIEDFFKFGFVRNPWDRVVSLYNRTEGRQMRDKMTFDEFVAWIQNNSDTSIFTSRHKHQLDWFSDENGEVLVDFIGKFEHLERDWKYVCEQLGISIDLPHIRKNAQNTQHYTEYYSDKTKAIIEQKFRLDIEYFGYSFCE